MDKIIVLCAGASSRFWPLSSTHHKCFYRLGVGKTILEETIESILGKARNVSEISLVVAPRDLDLTKELFGTNERIKIYVQETPSGEGQALLLALGNYSGKFFLTTGDKINASLILEKLLEFDLSVAVRKTDNTKHFGIVELDKDNRITSVTEKPGEGKEHSNIKITSAYLLDSKFSSFLKKFESEHYSLESALDEYVQENHVKGVPVDEIENTRLKFPWDLLDINKKVQKRKHIHSIHDSVKIAKSSVIEGDVYIGRGAIISDFVKIVGPVYIGENSFIGDFSLVRDNTFIDRNVTIGAHCEVKNSIIYPNVTIHRSYIGDSIIDEGGRIGGGVVLANKRYDRKSVKSVIKGEKIDTGIKALGAIVGANASIGTNATLMPGVKIGKNSIVWPGSVVLEDVEDEGTSK